MNSTREEILNIVKEISNNNDINFNNQLLDEGIIDSLSTIMLIQRLEEDFNIEINNNDLNHDNFNIIENIYLLISVKIKR